MNNATTSFVVLRQRMMAVPLLGMFLVWMAQPCPASPTAAGAAASAPSPSNWRDPMQPPYPATRTGLVQSGDVGLPPEDTLPPVQHIVIRQGQAHVLSQGRLLKPGEPLGAARITRISDSAVWVNLHGQSLKLPLYPGVEKRTPPPDTLPESQTTPRQKKPRPLQNKEAAR